MIHKHHILPKHAGGTDEPSNIIHLTVKEHAEAHRILFEQYGKKQDEIAWKGLAGIIGKEEIVSEVCRLAQKSAKVLRGIEHPYYGKKRPEHSAKLKGRKVTHSKEHREKLNNRFTDEYLKNVSNSIARDWKVVTPDGEILYIHNMSEFCRKHNLPKSSMTYSHKNKKPTADGYLCEKLS